VPMYVRSETAYIYPAGREPTARVYRTLLPIGGAAHRYKCIYSPARQIRAFSCYTSKRLFNFRHSKPLRPRLWANSYSTSENCPDRYARLMSIGLELVLFGHTSRMFGLWEPELIRIGKYS